MINCVPSMRPYTHETTAQQRMKGRASERLRLDSRTRVCPRVLSPSLTLLTNISTLFSVSGVSIL